MIAQLLLATALGVSVQDHLDGTEIGDANLTVSFETKGKYRAETEAKEKTKAEGTWAVQGNTVEVKVASCKGPACDKLGKGFKAEISLVAERAMTVRSSPADAPLTSGSYYCHYGACEKRVGVQLVTRSSGNAPVMKYLLDFLIDKNVSRGGNGTVVWWARRAGKKAEQTELSSCAREEDRGKKGAELVAKDLAELPWLGALQPKGTMDKDCLYDVQVMVKDDAELPPAAKH